MVDGDWAPGDVVDDRFRIAERAGEGGFATVWRAVDDRTGAEVALKTPRVDDHDREEVVARIEREYDALAPFARALHPTALGRFVGGRTDPPRYVACEFVGGGDLPDAMVERGVAPGPETLAAVGLPVVRAVGFCHANGRLHLDVKPANVRLRDRDDLAPVLVDFNTALPLGTDDDALYHEGVYKPPEQTPGGAETAVDPRTDVYAAGKLCAYLLTGSVPEDDPDGVDVDVDAPTAVAREVRRATRHDPDDRHPHAVSLASALERALGRDDALASATHAETDVRVPVRPGDVVGRLTGDPDDPLPTHAVPDPERHVSPHQVGFERDDGWIVEDRSLNGTYVRERGEEGWTELHCSAGRRRLREAGVDVDDDVADRHRVSSVAEVAPVDPAYGVRFAFDPDP